MDFLRGIADWKQARVEKVRTDMESLGRCPDCRGRGFTSSFTSVYLPPTYDAIFDCPGCNGSGQYEDWNGNNA
ncbi:methionine aminopeptidase [Bacillus sp. UMB0899]|nr:methionine aminopeptidase [Bacillus sp. UMB0899]